MFKLLFFCFVLFCFFHDLLLNQPVSYLFFFYGFFHYFNSCFQPLSFYFSFFEKFSMEISLFGFFGLFQAIRIFENFIFILILANLLLLKQTQLALIKSKNVESPLCSFGRSEEKTYMYLYYSCMKTSILQRQPQNCFSAGLDIPSILPQSAFLCLQMMTQTINLF